MEEVKSAAGLGAAIASPQLVDDTPFVVVPEEFEVRSLEEYLRFPTRKRGTIELHDAESFCAVVADQKTPSTRLYGNRRVPAFKAVFDDHGAGDEAAGWRDHIASYRCPLSVEWQTWVGADKRSMAQTAFAQFIEDNAPDCVVPDSATMIEVSRSLEAKKKVEFTSSIRLSTGQHEITYNEDISGTAGKGKLQVPETFTIGIAVLEGGPKYAVKARLRYRIGDKGALAMWYDLERPHKVIEDAVKEVWAVIEQKTGMKVLNGE